MRLPAYLWAAGVGVALQGRLVSAANDQVPAWSVLEAVCGKDGGFEGVMFTFHAEDLPTLPTQLRFHLGPSSQEQVPAVASWKAGLGNMDQEDSYPVEPGQAYGSYIVTVPKKNLGSGGTYKHYVIYTQGTIADISTLSTASTEDYDIKRWAEVIACPGTVSALSGGPGEGDAIAPAAASGTSAWSNKQGVAVAVLGGGLMALVVGAAVVARRRRVRKAAEVALRRLEETEDGAASAHAVEYRPKDHTQRALARVLQGAGQQGAGQHKAEEDLQGESIEI